MRRTRARRGRDRELRAEMRTRRTAPPPMIDRGPATSRCSAGCGERWRRGMSASGSRATRTAVCSPARRCSSTTSSCRGMLHAAFLRSPHAHARILRDRRRRRRARRAGVVAVYTADDLGDYWRPGPLLVPPPPIDGHRVQRAHPGAARQGQGAARRRAGRARHRREPLPRRGRARATSWSSYEPLPAVVDLEAALQPGAALRPRRSRQQRRGAGAPDQGRLRRAPRQARRTASFAGASRTTAAPRRRSRRAASWRSGTPRATG